jgi:hypothetical protein
MGTASNGFHTHPARSLHDRVDALRDSFPDTELPGAATIEAAEPPTLPADADAALAWLLNASPRRPERELAHRS